MFLVSSLSIVALFIFSLIMPVMSFTLPVYKIKKMKDLTFKQKLLANIIAMCIIAFINPILLVIYLGFFIVIEVLYYFFNKLYTKIKKFDRVVIISILITIFVGLIMFFTRNEINTNTQLLMEVYEKNMGMSSKEVQEIAQHIRDNGLYYLFSYSILSVFLTYLSLDIKDYEKWEISFEWLLIYIVPFFMVHLLKIENFYINNFMKIGEVIFIFFGIKTIYKFLGNMIRFKAINNTLALLTALLVPFGTFVLGVLGGFNVDVYIKKDKNRLEDKNG